MSAPESFRMIALTFILAQIHWTSSVRRRCASTAAVNSYLKSGRPGLVVMGGDSNTESSNPSTVYWMDIFYIYLLYKLLPMFV